MSKKSKALDKECTACKAKPGERCQKPNGSKMMTSYHFVRLGRKPKPYIPPTRTNTDAFELIKTENEYLKARNAELIALVEGDIEPVLKRLEMTEDSTELEILEGRKNPWAVKLLAASFANTLGDAKNYIEITLKDNRNDKILPMIITIQKLTGKSPDQLRKEAEKELQAFKNKQGLATLEIEEAHKLLDQLNVPRIETNGPPHYNGLDLSIEARIEEIIKRLESQQLADQIINQTLLEDEEATQEARQSEEREGWLTKRKIIGISFAVALAILLKILI